MCLLLFNWDVTLLPFCCPYKAKIIRHGKKVRIILDVAEELVKDIDHIREGIGVDRGALIKVWLHERIQQEKASPTHTR